MPKLTANYSIVAHDVVGNPIQHEVTSDHISGKIESGTNVFSIYPSASGKWDLRQTPFLTAEFFCDVVISAGDQIAAGSQNGLNLVVRYNNGTMSSEPIDLTNGYGTKTPNSSDDGQWATWRDNGTSSHKITIDLRTVIPDLSDVTQISLWCVRGLYSMNQTPMNFYFGDLEVSGEGDPTPPTPPDVPEYLPVAVAIGLLVLVGLVIATKGGKKI